jgi:hypothetical protein
MKISLALGNPQALSRQTAWGCLTTNLAMPGFGSVVAGRRVGYVQAAIYLSAFVITVVFGMRFILWALQNWKWVHGEEGDRLEALAVMWRLARWPLVGILGFLVSWLWALATSLSIVSSVKKNENAAIPPKL